MFTSSIEQSPVIELSEKQLAKLNRHTSDRIKFYEIKALVTLTDEQLSNISIRPNGSFCDKNPKVKLTAEQLSNLSDAYNQEDNFEYTDPIIALNDSQLAIVRKFCQPSTALSDAQVSQLIIEMPCIFGLIPNPEIKEKLKDIKIALKNRWKISIKNESVEPIGLINDGIYIRLVTITESNQKKVYYLSDIDDLEIKKHYKVSQTRTLNQARDILKLVAKDSHVPGLPGKQNVKLAVQKEAFLAFKGGMLEHAYTEEGKSSYRFEETGPMSGTVIFTHDINIGLLNFISQFGSSIKIEYPSSLEQALDIHLRCKNPYDRADKFKKLFRNGATHTEQQEVIYDSDVQLLDHLSQNDYE